MKPKPIALFFLFTRILYAQIQDKVDFIRAEVSIEPVLETKQIKGSVRYEFQVLQNVDSIFLDAHNMDFSSVLLDLNKADFVNDGKKVVVKNSFKKGETHFLVLKYVAKPKQTVYFFGWNDDESSNDQIWTQGQGKYTSHWLPSFDDMNEKVEFDISISNSTGVIPISNGMLTEVKSNHEGGLVSYFDMQKPMSSYLVAFTMGNFKKQIIRSASEVPIELYYEPGDSLKIEPTYRYTKQIFDFLEKEIGVPYPWQNYKQVPVQDFLYAGMENTTATIFSNTFMVDSTAFFDKNYVNVNAHELAHQWFGNLVTEESGSHHWLHEGFATYYAYLAEKEIFGEDHFYWHLLETAQSLSNFSGEGNGEALTNANAGSLTFYEKGAWALVMLRERVGDASFRKGIQNYLTNHAFQNVTIPDFMEEMEKTSGMDLSDFEKLWLQESEFPYTLVQEFLMDKSHSLKQYLSFKDSIGEDSKEVGALLQKNWNLYESNFLKHQLVLEYGNSFSTPFLKQLLQNEDVKVRQAVALSTKKIPLEIQSEFETLLGDKSYKTVEAVLYRLWTDFPEKQKTYLDRTSEINGLPNKNIRMLWLTLALVSPEYNIGQKPTYFEELVGYTGPDHHFEIRMLAFEYLQSIGGFSEQSLKNLVNACNHHVWYFKKSSRKILKDFLKQERNVALIRDIYPSLNKPEQEYLDKALGK